MKLTELTLTQASDLVKQRQISPVELTQAYLARIESLEPRLNCFITLTPEIALHSAHEAESCIQKGEYRGALHGIPVALKDIYETKEVRTTAGSKFYADYIPESDGAVVSRIKAGGAILLGKLNMHEIALGVTNNNPHYGACHNPWNLEKVPGGSSGGSGAALAAGLCLGSLGSDTGGSIRIPASLCGVVGLKPTYGRVSLRGVIPLSWNLDHAGPLARRVRDVAILLQAIAGYDPQDPYSANIPTDDYGVGNPSKANSTHLETGSFRTNLAGWRVALACDEFFSEADHEVQSAVQAAGVVFEQLGAKVNRVEIPNGRTAAQANGRMVTSDAAAYHKERMEDHPEYFGADVLERLRQGASYSAADYSLCRRTQTLVRFQFEQFFMNYDILLTPTTPITAPPIQGPDAVEQARLLTGFTAPFNLTGLPALSLPCGFSQEGLPIGLQIISRPWGEAQIFGAAYAFEQATQWHQRVPLI